MYARRTILGKFDLITNSIYVINIITILLLPILHSILDDCNYLVISFYFGRTGKIQKEPIKSIRIRLHIFSEDIY